MTPTHIKLTPDTVAGGIGTHQISPDGSHVVYMADQDTFGVVELYSVPITGGAAVKLNGALAEGQDVYSFIFSPDGNYVVFDVHQNATDTFAIDSTPTIGGTPVRLTPDAPADSRIIFLANFNPISRDSQHVVYSLQKKDTNLEYALYSVPIGGGASVLLTPALVEGGTISGFRLGPNAQRVVYAATQENASITELYSVPIAGGAVTKLSISLSNGESVVSGYFSVSSARVIYFVDRSSGREIYSTPIEGGESIRINDVVGSASITWSAADGSLVLYAISSGDLTSGNADFTLYTKSIGGGNSLKISSSVDTEGVNTAFNFVMPYSNNEQQIFFSVSNASGMSIYRVPVAGGTNVKIAGPLTPTSGIQLTKDGQHIVYATYNSFATDPARLYSIDVATGQSITLDEVQIAGFFSSFYWTLTPDHTGAIYFGSKGGSKKQLYYASLAGGTPTVLNVDYSDMDPPLVEPATQPVSYNGQTCVVYGFKFPNSSDYHSLYSSCFGGAAVPQQNVYLPMISQ
ncbi:MAG: hypothetical protein U0175_15035 [Caldilineaceae bacterium]